MIPWRSALAISACCLAPVPFGALAQGVSPPMVHETRNALGEVVSKVTLAGCSFLFEGSRRDAGLTFFSTVNADLSDIRMFEAESIPHDGLDGDFLPLVPGADPVRFTVRVTADDPADLAALSGRGGLECSDTECIFVEDWPGLPATFVNMDAIAAGRVTDDWSEFRAAVDSCRNDITQ